jgi:DNA-binding NtrC family response regulator
LFFLREGWSQFLLDVYMKRKKILVIDDEADFTLLMTEYFTNRGFEVYTAGNIHEGLRILDEERPEYLFLDNNLPDGLGWGSIEHILVNYPKTQLNLISAYHVPKTSSSSFRILEKPLLLEDLKKLVEA